MVVGKNRLKIAILDGKAGGGSFLLLPTLYIYIYGSNERGEKGRKVEITKIEYAKRKRYAAITGPQPWVQYPTSTYIKKIGIYKFNERIKGRYFTTLEIVKDFL